VAACLQHDIRLFFFFTFGPMKSDRWIAVISTVCQRRQLKVSAVCIMSEGQQECLGCPGDGGQDQDQKTLCFLVSEGIRFRYLQKIPRPT
jgi:hypothetical protein